MKAKNLKDLKVKFEKNVLKQEDLKLVKGGYIVIEDVVMG